MKQGFLVVTQRVLDRISRLSQTSLMSRSIKKFIAVFIAIWLPLFSGNMMAMPVAMLGSGSASHAATAEHGSAHASSQHHMAAATGHCSMHDDSASGNPHSDTGCKHPAACQLVVAAGRIEIALLTLSEFETPYASSFESHSATPLDPPPLARV